MFAGEKGKRQKNNYYDKVSSIKKNWYEWEREGENKNVAEKGITYH